MILTRRRGADTAHTQMGRPTYATPTREYTHILLLIKSLTLGKTKFASNLARRRRKNHGFEPHIGKKCFPARFLPFCLPRFVLCFPPSVLPAALSLPAAPFTFSGSHCPLLTYISSCHTRPARLIFPIFLVRPPEFCLSPDREHRLRQAAQRFSPCSSPHLAPFAPSRLPCCLGLSCSPLGFSP